MSITQVPASRMINYDTGSFCFRNKIINGDMRIDQRNAGAAITGVGASGGSFAVDRFRTGGGGGDETARYTIQQVADAPAGFFNSLRATVTTASTPAAGHLNLFTHIIEGQNITEFGFGTSSAKTITLSFWVKSSIAGNFCVAITNGAQSAASYSYPALFTINSTNTWEYKTITVPGPTAGIWNLSTNNVGLRLDWNLSCGSTYTAANSNTWYNGGYYNFTGGVNISITAGATFQITGVQLEAGPTATPFEYRPIGTELALCQRYFETNYPSGVAVGTSNTGLGGVWTSNVPAVGLYLTHPVLSFIVPKRAVPIMTGYNPQTQSVNAGAFWSDATGGVADGQIQFYNTGQQSTLVKSSTTMGTANNYHHMRYTADAEL